MQKRTKPARAYWRRMGLALLKSLAGAALLIALLVAALIVYETVQVTHGVIVPGGRVPVTETPATIGLSNYQDVSITTSDGILLKAWYIPPRAGVDRVILLLHGHGGNRQMMLYEVNILAPQGYGFFMFDFRAEGESGGQRVTLGDLEQLDVSAALDWLNTRPEVKHIGAVGFSLGATVLTLSAAHDTRIEQAVIISPYANTDDLVAYHGNFFGLLTQIPAYLAVRAEGVDPQRIQPEKELCKISPRPVLLAVGEEDRYLPPNSGPRMKAAAMMSFKPAFCRFINLRLANFKPKTRFYYL